MRKNLVVYAIGALIVLLTTAVLSIYKPWGRTPHGRRVQLERQTATTRIGDSRTECEETGWYVLSAMIALVVAVLVLHLVVGGFRGH